jgi:hypothetical protein
MSDVAIYLAGLAAIGAALAYLAAQSRQLSADLKALHAAQAATERTLQSYTDAVSRLSVRKPRGRPPKKPAAAQPSPPTGPLLAEIEAIRARSAPVLV